MKKMIGLLMLLVVTNTMAFEASGLSAYITFFSSGGNICKEARQVINDANEYSQSGVLSVYLADKIKAVQATSETISEEDALDILVNEATNIVVNN